MNLLQCIAMLLILLSGALPQPAAAYTPAAAVPITVGAQIETTADTKVRDPARLGKVLCTQPAGSLGTVMDGPYQSSGVVWWNIDYASACDGWAAESLLSVMPEIPGVDLSFCDDTVSESAGALCAVQPSATDIRIKDVYNASGSQEDQTYGFGYHAVAIPKDWNNVKGLSIYLAGAYSQPYSFGSRYFYSSVWLDEQMAEGYAVIQLAYNNRYSVNEDLCGKSNSGYNRDNCAGEVREEMLTGTDVSPYIINDVYNGIDYRLQALLKYLAAHGVVFPDVDPNNIDWSKIRISGHSQGANQSYYIARKRTVAFDCILSGGMDAQDAINPNKNGIADWFVTGTSLTPTQNLGALVATAEPHYTVFMNGLQFIGLTSDQIVQATQTSFYDEYGQPIDPHAATVLDPSLAPLRAQACFGRTPAAAAE